MIATRILCFSGYLETDLPMGLVFNETLLLQKPGKLAGAQRPDIGPLRGRNHTQSCLLSLSTPGLCLRGVSRLCRPPYLCHKALSWHFRRRATPRRGVRAISRDVWKNQIQKEESNDCSHHSWFAIPATNMSPYLSLPLCLVFFIGIPQKLLTMKIHLSPRKPITHNGRCALCEWVTFVSMGESNPFTLKESEEGTGAATADSHLIWSRSRAGHEHLWFKGKESN